MTRASNTADGEQKAAYAAQGGPETHCRAIQRQRRRPAIGAAPFSRPRPGGSGVADSNRHYNLGRVVCCRYTNPALLATRSIRPGPAAAPCYAAIRGPQWSRSARAAARSQPAGRLAWWRPVVRTNAPPGSGPSDSPLATSKWRGGHCFAFEGALPSILPWSENGMTLPPGLNPPPQGDISRTLECMFYSRPGGWPRQTRSPEPS